MKLKDDLIKLRACREAVEWVEDRDLPTVWAECERADWMLWYAAKKGIERKLLVKCACLIARRVLHLVPLGEDRPRKAIETAEAWIEGKATLDEVRTAARAAVDAAAYAVDAAAYAVDAAADAAYAAAEAAARAAAEAAARAAAYAAYAAAYAAYAAERKAQTDIVRKIIPVELLETGVAGKEGK